MGHMTLNHESLIETALYRVRLARSAGDLARAQALRARQFRGAMTTADTADADRYDPLCRHMLVEDRATGAVVCTCRLMGLPDGSRIDESYSAHFYDLTLLGAFAGGMMEIGRFCIAPEARDADVLRLAWAALARIVAAEGIALLFGCSSFPGTDAAAYGDAFALLEDRYIAPSKWSPRVKAPDVVRFAGALQRPVDVTRAHKAMPPLLRTYLAMSGWVSDHAVRDRDLGTLHVFTGLEVGRVPAARRRALAALAGS